MRPRHRAYYAIALVNLGLLLIYFYRLDWTPLEIVRFTVGVALLWGPLAAACFAALHSAGVDGVVRVSFSLVASYCLTTLLYFVCAFFGAAWLFYLALASTGLASAYAAWRAGWRMPSLNAAVHWPLVTIIAASLVTLVPFSQPLVVDPASGARIDRALPDHYYHTGLAAELKRQVPPSQATLRAGTPERAYHMFPHLTTMLIAKFTGQQRMLRAHIVYHYAAITVLICVALYSIGWMLSRSRVAACAAAALPFVLAVPMPSIGMATFSYFYATALPQFTSSFFPVVYTSPQMFSGIVVAYAAMLGVSIICADDTVGRRSSTPIALVTAALIATALRFRIHVFISLAPAFGVLALVMTWRTRRAIWLVALALLALLAVALYVEMTLPTYLSGTTGVRFGLNTSGLLLLYNWPGAIPLQNWVVSVLHGMVLHVTWQLAVAFLFVALSMIGLPMLCATLYAAFWGKVPKTFSLFVGIAVVVSIVLSRFIIMDYDVYSVPVQLLFHVSWYVLPLAAVGIAAAIAWARRWIRVPRAAVLAAVPVAYWGILLAQQSYIDDWRRHFSPPFGLSLASWEAFEYLRTRTSPDTVVLDARLHDQVHHFVSGLGERVAYLEAPGNPIDKQALRLNPADDRAQRIRQIWTATDPAKVCALLGGSPITILIEYAAQPLAVSEAGCLRTVWEGADKSVRLREVATATIGKGF
jgi:hypothetical protein